MNTDNWSRFRNLRKENFTKLSKKGNIKHGDSQNPQNNRSSTCHENNPQYTTHSKTRYIYF